MAKLAKLAKLANISGTGNMRIFAAASQAPLSTPGQLLAHWLSVGALRLARRSSRRARRVIRR